MPNFKSQSFRYQTIIYTLYLINQIIFCHLNIQFVLIKQYSKNISMNQKHISQQQPKQNINLQHLSTFRFPKSLQIGIEPPVLNKIQPGQNSFFCGYSNGMILQYTYASLLTQNQPSQVSNANSSQRFYSTPKTPQHKEVYYPYQNCDIIDIDVFSRDILLTCTHTEVTLLNLVKNKRISLRGHEQSPIAVSSHPVSPLVVSVSNLIIQHDLRMQKPILVNYITPPAYDIKFFPDGQFYLLSGQPIRIGKDKWMRTLQNGIANMSKNSKFIVSNDMNSKLTLWDWRKSQKLRIISHVKNQQLYQPVHFLSRQGINSEILFLQDDGNLLHHDIINNKTQRHKVLQLQKDDNWKCQISAQGQKTKHVIIYQHQKTQIKCFSINK